jgi:hypothetical protein
MQNEPIHEVRFLKYLTNKLKDEVAASNHILSNDQLDNLFSGIDKLYTKLEQIEKSANIYHEQYGFTKQH